MIKKIAERDQGNASDALWNHITVRDRELTGKEAFHEFGRDELPVGRVGRTDEGSFEDLEDRESTRNGEEKLWQILAFRKHGQIQKGIEQGNTGQSTAINNGTEK